MAKLGARLKRGLAALLDYFMDVGYSDEAGAYRREGLSAEEKRIVKWRNSAGQLVQSRVSDRRLLEGVAQTHIDSYASYAEDATPASRLQNAQSTAEQFKLMAHGARVLEDIEGGEGRFRFTVKAGPGSQRQLV